MVGYKETRDNKLVIKSCTKADEGTYQCKAKNRKTLIIKDSNYSKLKLTQLSDCKLN